jgi:hypothetical protein
MAPGAFAQQLLGIIESLLPLLRGSQQGAFEGQLDF